MLYWAYFLWLKIMFSIDSCMRHMPNTRKCIIIKKKISTIVNFEFLKSARIKENFLIVQVWLYESSWRLIKFLAWKSATYEWEKRKQLEFFFVRHIQGRKIWGFSPRRNFGCYDHKYKFYHFRNVIFLFYKLLWTQVLYINLLIYFNYFYYSGYIWNYISLVFQFRNNFWCFCVFFIYLFSYWFEILFEVVKIICWIS